MIPVVLGTIASSRRGSALPASDSYTVAVDCANGSPYTIYVLPGQPISTGTNTIVYTNNSLTTLLTNTSFVYLNYTYTVDGSGLITGAAACNRSWNIYPDCNTFRDGPFYGTYYTAFSQTTLQTGVVVYTDQELLTPIPDGSSFVADGVIYTSSGAAEPGAITSTAACGYSWPYGNSGCGQPDLLGTYFYTTTTSISIGTIIYNSSNLDGRLAGLSIYRYGYNTYLNTDVDGVVESINSCPT